MTKVSKVKYKVERYDEINKILVVKMDDVHWANIPVMTGLPQSAEELDALVARFAPKVEQVTEIPTDSTFIVGVIGKSRNAKREQFEKTVDLGSPTKQPVDTSLVLAEDAEKEWVTGIVMDILKAQGLIKES